MCRGGPGGPSILSNSTMASLPSALITRLTSARAPAAVPASTRSWSTVAMRPTSTLRLSMGTWPTPAARGLRLAREGRANLKPLAAGVGQVPIESRSVDVGLMATVLHDLVEAGTAAGALAEVSRVIKAEGRLAIVEFDKIDGPPGPPRHIRLDPAEVEGLVAPYGFAREQTLKLGPYNYLITFSKISNGRMT